MDVFLGFIVLTGPLFFIVLWIPVCIFLAVLVGRKFIKKPWPFKIAGGLVAFLFVLILPAADEITGRIYLNHLCKTEAGPKVYQAIKLPSNYWDEKGNLKLIKSNGDLDRKLLENKISEGRESEVFVPILGIKKRRYMLKNNSNEIVGEKIDFLYPGGWVIENLTTGGPYVTCGNKFKGKEFWYDFYSSLFEPVSISGQ